MIDLTHASRVFEEYLDSFCREDEKIKLKIIHTQGVIRCAAQIAARMGLEKRRRRPGGTHRPSSRHRAF